MDVHIQQNKLRAGIKETKWVVEGTLMNITSLDLSVFAGRLWLISLFSYSISPAMQKKDLVKEWEGEDGGIKGQKVAEREGKEKKDTENGR